MESSQLMRSVAGRAAERRVMAAWQPGCVLPGDALCRQRPPCPLQRRLLTSCTVPRPRPPAHPGSSATSATAAPSPKTRSSSKTRATARPVSLFASSPPASTMHCHWRGGQEWRDLGLPLTTGSEEACKMFDATLTQYVGWYDDASVGGMEGSLAAMGKADSKFVMGRVLELGLELMGTGRAVWRDAQFQAQVSALIDLAGAPSVTPRERQHSQAVQLWSLGECQKACNLWEDILVEHPLDMVALKFAHDAYFYLGQSQNIRDSIARVFPRWKSSIPFYGYLHGMHAFGLEETNLYSQAEKAARKGLELVPRDAWATHAMCHVLEMEGRQDEGIRFLESSRQDWTTCGMLACHNYWHWALYHLEKGEYEPAVEIFDQQVKPRFKSSGAMLDMVDAASLLFRLKMEGVPVKEKWRDVQEACRGHLDDHQLVFNDVHMLMACLGSGDSQLVDQFLSSITTFVKEGQGAQRWLMAELGEPLCQATQAYFQGDFQKATDLLLPLRYKIVLIGGSHAQRDLFNLMLISSALQSSQTHHHKLARCLLAERKALKEKAPMTDRLIARAVALHAD